MLTNGQANRLMRQLMKLRNAVKKRKTVNAIKNLKEHEALCMEKFKYIITMHTSSYRDFPNYEDLNQEGNVALISALKTFRFNKGSVFWWLHKYISTRISRQANTHTTIRYPLKYSKKHPPRKESKLPTIIEKRDSFCPEKSLEGAEITAAIETAAECLNRKQKEIIKLYFGLTGDAPKSITKVCKKMKISRVNAVEILNNALDILRQNIQI